MLKILWEKVHNLSFANACLFLVVLCFTVYSFSLHNNFIGDDVDQVVENPLVHFLSNIPAFFIGNTYVSNLQSNYYRPMMLSVFTVLFSTFGATPWIFHMVQILFHTANTILVLILFRKFFKLPLALFLSAIFAIHPLNTEAVIYISALQDTLFLFFGLFGLVICMTKQHNNKKNLLISISFLLSLLSKETGVCFIIMACLYAVYFHPRNLPRVIFISFLTGMIYFAMRVMAVGLFSTAVPFVPIMKADLLTRLFTLPAITLYYLKSFFFPKDILFNQIWVVKTIHSWSFYISVIILSIGLFLLKVYIKKIRIKEMQKRLIFFIIWTLLGLALHSQIIPLDNTVADRWFYFSMIGVLGFIGELLVPVVQANQKIKTIYFISAVCILFLLLGRSVFRIADWKDGIRLYTHDLKKQPENFILENSLGYEYGKIYNYSDSKFHYQRSIAIESQWWQSWNNLGQLYLMHGNITKAKQSLERATSLTTYVLPHENIAWLKLLYESAQSAKQYAVGTLKIYPNSSKLWLTMALADYQLNNRGQALEELDKSYRLSQNPALVSIYASFKEGKPIDLNATPVTNE